MCVYEFLYVIPTLIVLFVYNPVQEIWSWNWEAWVVGQYFVLGLSENVPNFKVKCYELLRLGMLRSVFLNRRAAARYQALASIILGRERFSWNLSF